MDHPFSCLDRSARSITLPLLLTALLTVVASWPTGYFGMGGQIHLPPWVEPCRDEGGREALPPLPKETVNNLLRYNAVRLSTQSIMLRQEYARKIPPKKLMNMTKVWSIDMMPEPKSLPPGGWINLEVRRQAYHELGAAFIYMLQMASYETDTSHNQLQFVLDRLADDIRVFLLCPLSMMINGTEAATRDLEDLQMTKFKDPAEHYFQSYLTLLFVDGTLETLANVLPVATESWEGLPMEPPGEHKTQQL